MNPRHSSYSKFLLAILATSLLLLLVVTSLLLTSSVLAAPGLVHYDIIFLCGTRCDGNCSIILQIIKWC